MSVEFSDNRLAGVWREGFKVVVLCGGIGEEREVSLESGERVYKGLMEAGFDTKLSDICPEDISVLDESDVDVFFVMLHGRFGEDGQLQRIMEAKGLVYTGSGPEASRLAFDKLASKKLFSSAGVSVPSSVEYKAGQEDEFRRGLVGLSDKFVIKPVRGGSSVGVRIFSDVEAAVEGAGEVSEQFGECFAEEFISGREVTVGVLCGESLPVIEIRPRSGFYDYHSKYIDAGTEYLFDTIQEKELLAKIEQTGLACFEVLGCSDFGRADFILGDDGVVYALEVNTIPGFTEHSLVPKAAARAGKSMAEVCGMIVKAALAKRVGKSAKGGLNFGG